MDEAWSLSFYYNYVNNGVETDAVFLASDGQSGVQYFGKIVAVIYGNILNLITWTRFNTSLVSFVLILLAGLVWYKIILKLFKDSKIAYYFLILFLVFEPFVANINSARAEAFILFISALSLLFFINKHYFVAIVLSLVALETHPVGVASLFTLILYGVAYRIKLTKKEVVQLILGSITGIFIYLTLHLNILSSFSGFLNSNTKTNWKSLFVQYFIEARYSRHLFDLLVIIAAGSFFLIKKLHKKYLFITILVVSDLVMLLVFPRQNINYVSLFFIGFIMLIAVSFSKLKYSNILLLITVLPILAQYVFLIKTNNGLNYDYVSQYISALVPTDLPVVGSSNEWFSFKDREYYASTITDRLPIDVNEFYLIEESDYRNLSVDNSVFKFRLENSCYSQIINSATYNNEEFVIRRIQCNI